MSAELMAAVPMLAATHEQLMLSWQNGHDMRQQADNYMQLQVSTEARIYEDDMVRKDARTVKIDNLVWPGSNAELLADELNAIIADAVWRDTGVPPTYPAVVYCRLHPPKGGDAVDDDDAAMYSHFLKSASEPLPSEQQSASAFAEIVLRSSRDRDALLAARKPLSFISGKQRRGGGPAAGGSRRGGASGGKTCRSHGEALGFYSALGGGGEIVVLDSWHLQHMVAAGRRMYLKRWAVLDLVVQAVQLDLGNLLPPPALDSGASDDVAGLDAYSVGPAAPARSVWWSTAQDVQLRVNVSSRLLTICFTSKLRDRPRRMRVVIQFDDVLGCGSVHNITLPVVSTPHGGKDGGQGGGRRAENGGRGSGGGQLTESRSEPAPRPKPPTADDDFFGLLSGSAADVLDTAPDVTMKRAATASAIPRPPAAPSAAASAPSASHHTRPCPSAPFADPGGGQGLQLSWAVRHPPRVYYAEMPIHLPTPAEDDARRRARNARDQRNGRHPPPAPVRSIDPTQRPPPEIWPPEAAGETKWPWFRDTPCDAESDVTRCEALSQCRNFTLAIRNTGEHTASLHRNLQVLVDCQLLPPRDEWPPLPPPAPRAFDPDHAAKESGPLLRKLPHAVWYALRCLMGSGQLYVDIITVELLETLRKYSDGTDGQTERLEQALYDCKASGQILTVDWIVKRMQRKTSVVGQACIQPPSTPSDNGSSSSSTTGGCSPCSGRGSLDSDNINNSPQMAPQEADASHRFSQAAAVIAPTAEPSDVAADAALTLQCDALCAAGTSHAPYDPCSSSGSSSSSSSSSSDLASLNAACTPGACAAASPPRSDNIIALPTGSPSHASTSSVGDADGGTDGASLVCGTLSAAHEGVPVTLAAGAVNEGSTSAASPPAEATAAAATPAAVGAAGEVAVKVADAAEEYWVRDSVLTARILVTPTRLVALPPESEATNRVLRHFHDHQGHFVRVTFSEESGVKMFLSDVLDVHGDMRASHDACRDVLERYRRIMTHGFRVAGRHYMLLAFSSSQLREGGAWFLADSPQLSVKNVHYWLGNFDNVTNIAKYAARLGQAFTSSARSVAIASDAHEETHDVVTMDEERDGNVIKYTFSDGVGLISSDLARDVMNKMGYPKHMPPAAMQIRYRGCKGMLVPWGPDIVAPGVVMVRPSMTKFEGTHGPVEVVMLAHFNPGFVNRQIILLLDHLKIKEEVFVRKTREFVRDLNQAISTRQAALLMVKKYMFLQGFLGTILSAALTAGVPPYEPFLRGCLEAVRKHALRAVCEKARVFVDKSAFLFGVMDETGLLQYGEVFVQIQRRGELHATVLEPDADCGNHIIVTKNPCLATGDIRKLKPRADLEQLKHLVNVVVFPREGPRPHPNEIGGSDLDGDVYFVCWDPELVPWQQDPPMDYSPGKARTEDKKIQMPQVVNFWLDYQRNDRLGRIDNAHLVHADRDGAGCDACQRLAELHSIAVDYAKTGIQAMNDAAMHHITYPHYLEKEDKALYHSTSVLGKMYDEAKKISQQTPLISYAAQQQLDASFVLAEHDGFEAEVQTVWPVCLQYNTDVLRCMNRYGLSDEGELMSGWIVSTSAHQQRKNPHDLKEQVLTEVKLLHRRFKGLLQDVGADASGAAAVATQSSGPVAQGYAAANDSSSPGQDASISGGPTERSADTAVRTAGPVAATTASPPSPANDGGSPPSPANDGGSHTSPGADCDPAPGAHCNRAPGADCDACPGAHCDLLDSQGPSAHLDARPSQTADRRSLSSDDGSGKSATCASLHVAGGTDEVAGDGGTGGGTSGGASRSAALPEKHNGVSRRMMLRASAAYWVAYRGLPQTMGCKLRLRGFGWLLYEELLAVRDWKLNTGAAGSM